LTRIRMPAVTVTPSTTGALPKVNVPPPLVE
jgi:hypothetical protein